MDNLVQIGHNVVMGKENLVVAQVGVAGSAKIGNGVTLAAQAGISGHLSIGDNALIGPRAGVAKDVPPGFQGGGAPLVDGQTFLRTLGIMPKLPDMYRRFLKLERELEELRKTISDNQGGRINAGQ
jgi:UDP-3-O-[3-hydroxymyristoyl] glucosamine N-acyltransferase